MDLSKAYDCIQHDLLIAKLEAYGFSINSLNYLYSYLSNRKQRVKISSAFSEWLEIKCGVPQGSILGPLLFNIFINDIFLFIYETELCNFADDNTIYVSDKHIDNILTKLKNELRRLLKWFANNSMVANKEKFQLMFLGAEKDIKYEDLSVTIDKIVIKATENVKLLGIDIDNKLKFTTHIEKMCSKVNSKTNALRRIRKYLTVDKAVTLFNAFILSNFNYCPIIWMFCRKSANVVINKAGAYPGFYHCKSVISLPSPLSPLPFPHPSFPPPNITHVPHSLLPSPIPIPPCSPPRQAHHGCACRRKCSKIKVFRFPENAPAGY